MIKKIKTTEELITVLAIELFKKSCDLDLQTRKEDIQDLWYDAAEKLLDDYNDTVDLLNMLLLAKINNTKYVMCYCKTLALNNIIHCTQFQQKYYSIKYV